MTKEQHFPDGKRWHDSASYSGLVFVCGCGERFMEYQELVEHCEKEAKHGPAN